MIKDLHDHRGLNLEKTKAQRFLVLAGFSLGACCRIIGQNWNKLFMLMTLMKPVVHCTRHI